MSKKLMKRLIEEVYEKVSEDGTEFSSGPLSMKEIGVHFTDAMVELQSEHPIELMSILVAGPKSDFVDGFILEMDLGQGPIYFGTTFGFADEDLEIYASQGLENCTSYFGDATFYPVSEDTNNDVNKGPIEA